jgi:hypothetical protein
MRAFLFSPYNDFTMTTTAQRVLLVGTLGLALLLSGCAKGKDEQAAYDVCLQAARKDPKLGNATFAAKEQSNIQGSTGDSGIRVNIPYELDGKKGLYQCIADKQTDGSYKVSF